MRLFLIITIIFKLRHKGIIVVGLIGRTLLVGSSGRSDIRGLLALRSWSYGCDHGRAVGGRYDRALRLLGRLLVVLIVLRLIFNISVQLHIFVVDCVVLIEGRRVVVASVVVVLVLIADSLLWLLGNVTARSRRGRFNSEWLRLGTVRKGTYFSLGRDGVDTRLLQDSITVALNLGNGARLATVDSLLAIRFILFDRGQGVVSFRVELGNVRLW